MAHPTLDLENKAQVALRKYIKILKLENYRIELKWNTYDGWDCDGTIELQNNRKEAILTLHAFLDEDNVDSIVCHGLIHLITAPIESLKNSWKPIIFVSRLLDSNNYKYKFSYIKLSIRKIQ